MSDRHTIRMLSLKCHTKKVDLSEVVFIFKYLRNCRNITPDELEFRNISFEEFLRTLICRSFAFALHLLCILNWMGFSLTGQERYGMSVSSPRESLRP